DIVRMHTSGGWSSWARVGCSYPARARAGTRAVPARNSPRRVGCTILATSAFAVQVSRPRTGRTTRLFPPLPWRAVDEPANLNQVTRLQHRCRWLLQLGREGQVHIQTGSHFQDQTTIESLTMPLPLL